MPGPESVCLSVTKTVPQLEVWEVMELLGGRSFLEEWCDQGCALKAHALPHLLFSLPVCGWKMSSGSFLLGPETLGFPKWLPFLSCHDQLYPPVTVGQSKQILVFYHSEVNWEQTRQGQDKNLEEGTETKTMKTCCTHSGLDLPTSNINKKIHLPTCL